MMASQFSRSTRSRLDLREVARGPQMTVSPSRTRDSYCRPRRPSIVFPLAKKNAFSLNNVEGATRRSVTCYRTWTDSVYFFSRPPLFFLRRPKQYNRYNKETYELHYFYDSPRPPAALLPRRNYSAEAPQPHIPTGHSFAPAARTPAEMPPPLVSAFSFSTRFRSRRFRAAAAYIACFICLTLPRTIMAFLS